MRFFQHLLQHLINFGPIKANPRSALLQLDCPHQRRKRQRHIIKRALFSFFCTLGSFDGFPIGSLLVGRFLAAFIAENMWMPRDHFIADCIGHIVKIKQLFFAGHLRVINGL